MIGWIPRSKVPHFLNSIKILILPSYTEGLPNVILEAMASGTIVLTTDVGAVKDAVNDGENGFILKNNSSAVIFNTLNKIINYPNLEKISDNAVKTIKLWFGYENAFKSFFKIRNKLISL